MNKGTLYGTFNARFMTPEEVALKFIPLPSFSRLVRDGHSVLMGPRGCGKTTLLKMLTRSALRVWNSSGRKERYQDTFLLPEYESIYIPSDERWLSEVRALSHRSYNPATSEQTQRVMISASILISVVDTFQAIIEDIATDEIGKRKYEALLCESLISLCKLKSTIPSFSDVSNKIDGLIVDLRAAVNSNNTQQLIEYLNQVPHIFYAHSLDPVIQSCRHMSPLLPNQLRPKKWAICFDELEIAPPWLQDELLSSLRSIDQSFFLKLTWNPILPKANTIPEPGADFNVIRLWNSHVLDPIDFCEQVTKSFLSDRFVGKNITPNDFLGYSLFASAKGQQDEHEYNRKSIVYKAMRDLAVTDQSFRQALIDHNINPDDPIPSDDSKTREKQMNEFFRKAKPIVLLRHAFLKDLGIRRTRKKVKLYSGKQAVYAVSEGNPRWLIGLLNDLHDSVDWSGKSSHKDYRIPATKQASIINATSRRFVALVKATPVAGLAIPNCTSIYELIDALAKIFSSAIYNNKFSLDPIGSFLISKDIPRYLEPAFRRALEMGALIHIANSPMDVPAGLVGERFRLTFMICPSYNLPLRNYRNVNLPDGIVNGEKKRKKPPRSHMKQLPITFEKDEDKKDF